MSGTKTSKPVWGLGLLAVGLALGLLLGYGTGRSTGSVLLPGGDDAGPAAPGRLAPAAPHTPRVVTAPAPRPEPELEMLRRVLAQIEVRIPAPPSGNGWIRGQVLDEEGRPVAGIRIRATPAAPPSVDAAFLGTRPGDVGKEGAASTDDDELENTIRDMVRRHRLSHAGQKEAVTGEDGRYAIEGLAHERYSVQASGENVELQPSFTAVTPDAELDFTAAELVPVPCEVLLPNGAEPDRASIRWQRQTTIGGARGSFGSSSTWTPAERVIRLRRGEYELTASAGPGDEMVSQSQKASVVSGFEGRLIFQLDTGTGIGGKIVCPEGFRSFFPMVRALKWNQADPPSLQRLSTEGKSTHVSLQGDRTYRIRDLEPGDYFVGIPDWSTRRILASGRTTVSNGLSALDLEIPFPARWEYLLVWAYGPDSQLLNDLHLSAQARSATGSWSSSFHGRNANGSYWILHPRVDDANPGDVTYSVTVQSGRYGRKTLEYTPGAAAEVTVRFEAPASLKVTVAGSRAKDAGRLNLALAAAGGRDRSNWQSLSADNRGCFANVAPGEYVLEVYADSRRVHAEPVTVRPGENLMTLTIPPLYTLTVIAEDRTLGDALMLRSAEAPEDTPWIGQSYAPLGANRRALFQNLPAGEYTIETAGGRRSASMRVNVTADAVVRFVASPRNAIRVVIADDRGYLRQAGFLSEDLIVAFNAVAFKELTSVETVLQGLKAMERVYATVVRGNNIFEIQIDPAKLLEGHIGGRLQPIEIAWQ